MKTQVLKSVMMLSVFGCAIFGAFAFTGPKADGKLTIVSGHLQVAPGVCQDQNFECSTIENPVPCKFGNAPQLREMGPTTCGNLLWEVQQ